MDLANHIAQLLMPIIDVMQGQNAADVDPRFEADLTRFRQCVTFLSSSSSSSVLPQLRLFRDMESVFNTLESQTKQGTFRRIVNNNTQSDEIVKCKEKIDNSYKIFQVCTGAIRIAAQLTCHCSKMYTMISIRLNVGKDAIPMQRPTVCP